jgi:hypothetical protein
MYALIILYVDKNTRFSFAFACVMLLLFSYSYDKAGRNMGDCPEAKKVVSKRLEQ